MPQLRLRFILLASASVLFAAPLAAAQKPAVNPELQERVDFVTATIKDMGLTPGTIAIGSYHVIYVGDRKFADERRKTLEFTRRNFFGFMRRLNIKVNEQHDRLLVILFEEERQMQEFHERATEGESLPSWVAGYYVPTQNWAVFYNQVRGSGIESARAELNAMADRLNATEGGAQTLLEFRAADGSIYRKTKGQIAREMEAEWARIRDAMIEFTTTVTQHEGVHQLAFNVGVQDRETAYPFWVSEGLACVFETPPTKGKTGSRQGAAKLNTERLADYRALKTTGRALGLEQLIRLDREAQVSSVGDLYAESWAVFSFLFARYPKELSTYMQSLARREPPTDDAEPIDEAAEFAKFFTKPLTELQREFDKYIEMLRE
jgi:hypothetical protein